MLWKIRLLNNWIHKKLQVEPVILNLISVHLKNKPTFWWLTRALIFPLTHWSRYPQQPSPEWLVSLPQGRRAPQVQALAPASYPPSVLPHKGAVWWAGPTVTRGQTLTLSLGRSPGHSVWRWRKKCHCRERESVRTKVRQIACIRVGAFSTRQTCLN